MKVKRKEAALLNKAIDHWQENELLDGATANKLKKSVGAYQTGYDALSVYAFVAAISCGILAFGALVLDEKWIERLRKIFDVSQFIIGAIFAALSVFLFWVSQKRVVKFPLAKLANESFNIQLALSIGVAATYFAKGFDADYHWYGLVIFFVAIAYGTCAYFLRSKLLWLCMLLAAAVCWGVQTYSWSNDEAHDFFLGMNYPLRMTVFGIIMIAGAHCLSKIASLDFFYKITWHFVWIFFLLAGLSLSVSGNYTYEAWAAIRQGLLIGWAVAYTFILIGLIVYAFRSNEYLLRDVFVIFFLLNLYTRFFEYFWDRTNKGLFFAILALSFWLIGRHAEKRRNQQNGASSANRQ